MITFIFYALLIILIIRIVNSFLAGSTFKSAPNKSNLQQTKKKKKKVGKEVGEYVDYEEVSEK